MFFLYKKELNYYLNNPIGYITISLFAFFANFWFVKDLFVFGTASMNSFFSLVPWFFVIFIPALSMRTFAEEKRTKTLEVLLSLPISEIEIVLAKFFAILTLILIALLLTLSLPISLSFFSKLYFPEVFAGYLGLLFLGALFISISIFFSLQTKNQVIAFLLSIIFLFLLMILSGSFLDSVLPKLFSDSLSYISPNFHFSLFLKGVLDLRSIFYFFSFTFVSLFLTIIALEKRR